MDEPQINVTRASPTSFSPEVEATLCIFIISYWGADGKEEVGTQLRPSASTPCSPLGLLCFLIPVATGPGVTQTPNTKGSVPAFVILLPPLVTWISSRILCWHSTGFPIGEVLPVQLLLCDLQLGLNIPMVPWFQFIELI